MKILVTGAAGFIGSHVCQRLLDRGDTVIGVDNLNNYYDVALKHERLEYLKNENFTFIKMDIAEKDKIDEVFKKYAIKKVVNLEFSSVKRSIK